MASNSEMVMTTQGTSHLLQKAAGFDIVGGQFVLGDVHNHPGPGLVHPNTSISLVTTLNEAFSESEIYCSLLLRQKRGFPLYVPGPLINLPAPYQVHGVAIGDVGRVTAEGMFDFFFNIFLPKEHPINANHTPQDFCPMTPYDSIDVCRFHYRPGNYVSTSTIQKVDLDTPSDEFPGGDFVFRCDSPEGAVLALPDGAYLQKLENLENIRTYAAKHADSWYNYINGERGRGLANGELYLVTGCEKARSWGMASYCVAHEEFQLMFKPTTRRGATYEPYRWIGPHGQKNPAKRKDHDPSTNDPLNQTTFIHGLSISLGTGLWARLFGTVTVETSSPADFQFRMNTTGASPTSSQRSLFSWSWNLLGGGSTGGNRHGVVLSVLSPIAKVFNPSKLINEYILHTQAPQATIVMTHDDDWRDILGDDSVLSPQDFFQRINDQFAIKEKDGVTFLASKPAPATSSPTDDVPPLITPETPNTCVAETPSRVAIDSPQQTSFRDGSPSPGPRRAPSPHRPAYTNRQFTALSTTSNPEHWDLIRTATSMLCREIVKPPVHMSRTEAGLRDWEEVELRVRALARLDRILGKSGVEGSSSNLPFDAPARLSVERERHLFTEALRDGFVLCQLMNKVRSGSIVRPDSRDDGFVRTSNITKFLAACSSYGLPNEDLFQRDDLIVATSESVARVARTIIALIKYVDTPIVERSKYGSAQFENRKVSSPLSPFSPYGQGGFQTAASSMPHLPTQAPPPPSPAPRARKRWSPPHSVVSTSSTTTETTMMSSLFDVSRFGTIHTATTDASSAIPSITRAGERDKALGMQQPGKPAIQLGKGKWPDDFMDALLPPKSPTANLRSASPVGISPRRKLVVRAAKLNESIESLPIRPRHRAQQSSDAPILLPKDSLMQRDSSPGAARRSRLVVRQPSANPHRGGSLGPRGDSRERSTDSLVPFPRTASGEHAAADEPPDRAAFPLSRPPRGRFQSDVEGSRLQPRPSSSDGLGASSDGLGAKPSRSRSESTMHIGANDLLRPDSFEGSFVRQVLIIQDEGKPPTHFQLGNCIGRGQFGSVYRALNLNTGQMVAVKRIRLEGLKEEEVTILMREVDLVKSLSHPSIIKYEGMARDQDTLSIVLEYAENGSLGQTLKAFGKLNEPLVASYVLKILEGLYYLHSSDVVHCDLKAANILTTKNGNIKLSDFGVSLNLRAMEREIKNVAGTPNWMAPEVIELKGASPKSDIWSLACTIVELLTGRPPYAEIGNVMSVMFRIMEDDMPPLPEGCSPLLEDFLTQCFNKDPTKRPSAEVLFEHPWLKKNWGAHKELRSQDSIPFLRRVSFESKAAPFLAHTPDPPVESEEHLSPGCRSSPSSRPMDQDISRREHSFIKTTFSKPMVCRVCLLNVKKSAVLCEQCSLIAHSRCAVNAPPTCDLHAQLLLYAQYAERGNPGCAFSNPPDVFSEPHSPGSPRSAGAHAVHPWTTTQAHQSLESTSTTTNTTTSVVSEGTVDFNSSASLAVPAAGNLPPEHKKPPKSRSPNCIVQ